MESGQARSGHSSTNHWTHGETGTWAREGELGGGFGQGHTLLPSAPMDTSFTPLEAMKSSALLTLAILWNLILPRSGLGNCSPEITSNNNISFSPPRKSSSMFSMPVPAFLKCELHHAVNVCNTTEHTHLYQGGISIFHSFINWNTVDEVDPIYNHTSFTTEPIHHACHGNDWVTNITNNTYHINIKWIAQGERFRLSLSERETEGEREGERMCALFTLCVTVSYH